MVYVLAMGLNGHTVVGAQGSGSAFPLLDPHLPHVRYRELAVRPQSFICGLPMVAAMVPCTGEHLHVGWK